MNCKKCGQVLNIKMTFVGTPVDREREYYCVCGAIYKGIPSKDILEEVTTFTEKELK